MTLARRVHPEHEPWLPCAKTLGLDPSILAAEAHDWVNTLTEVTSLVFVNRTRLRSNVDAYRQSNG